MCVSILAAGTFQHFGSWAQKTNWAPDFDDVVVLAGLKARDDYRFVQYVRYLSS